MTVSAGDSCVSWNTWNVITNGKMHSLQFHVNLCIFFSWQCFLWHVNPLFKLFFFRGKTLSVYGSLVVFVPSLTALIGFVLLLSPLTKCGRRYMMLYFLSRWVHEWMSKTFLHFIFLTTCVTLDMVKACQSQFVQIENSLNIYTVPLQLLSLILKV